VNGLGSDERELLTEMKKYNAGEKGGKKRSTTWWGPREDWYGGSTKG